MQKRLRPLFRSASGAYGALVRLARPWVPLPPLRLTLMVTRRCNLACPYCLVRRELNQPEADLLTLDEWKRVIDSVPRRMLVMLSGGEPFLAPDMPAILEYLLATRHLVSVVTNGTMLDDSTLERLVEGKLRYLMVSLDGMAECHDRIRGMPGAFERATSAVRTLNELKRRHRSAYPLTCVKTTVTEDNADEIPKLLKYAEETLEADHASVSLRVENPLQQGFTLAGELEDARFGRGNVYVYPAQVQTRIRRMVERVDAQRKGSPMHIEFAPPLGSAARLLEYLADPSKFGVRRCTVPWVEFTLYDNGDVSPCITYRIGNIRDLGYRVGRVMKHPRYLEFLDWHARTPYPRPCEGCCWGRHGGKPHDGA